MHTSEVFVGGQWRPPASGETYDTINPATEEVSAQRRQGRRAGRRRRGPGRPPRLRRGSVAADGRRRAGAHAVEARRPDQRQPRRDGAARERQHREDALRLRQGRDPVRGRGVPLLRGLGDEDPRRDAQPPRQRLHVHAAPAGRRRRRHRPLELPVPAGLLEDRPGAGRREHGRPQARLAHAPDRAPLRRAHPGGRAPRGRVQRGDGPRRQGRHGARPPPRRRQDRVHGLDRGRQGDHAGGRRDAEARVARARRQVAEHRLRRRRHGSGGPGRPDRDLLQQGRGVRGRLAPARGAADPRRVRREAGRPRQGPQGRRPDGQGDAHGPGRLRPADRDGARLRRGRQAARAPRWRRAASGSASATGKATSSSRRSSRA